MTFGTTPKDNAQIPLGSVYVPGTASSNLTALEGIAVNGPDANGQTSSAARMGMLDGDHVSFGAKADAVATSDTGTFTLLALFKRLLQKYQSTSTPMITEDQIRALIAAGQGFRATTGVLSTGAANAFIGVQAIANSLAKTCVIYNVYVSPANVTGDIREYQNNNATADTNLTGTMTSGNQMPNGGFGSTLVLSCSPAATTQTTGFVGTQTGSFGAAANTNQNLLQNGSQTILKNGVPANASWYVKIPTSANSAAITIEWVEF